MFLWQINLFIIIINCCVYSSHWMWLCEGKFWDHAVSNRMLGNWGLARKDSIDISKKPSLTFVLVGQAILNYFYHLLFI